MYKISPSWPFGLGYPVSKPKSPYPNEPDAYSDPLPADLPNNACW